MNPIIVKRPLSGVVTPLKSKLFSMFQVLVVALVATSAATVSAMQSPDQVVRSTVDTMVAKIQANRDAYKADETKLYKMLEDTLIPSIHMSRMANQILGKTYARSSTAAQKAEFAEVFKDFILTTYASGLLSATGKEKVNYKPINLKPGADIVKVEAELVSAAGESYPINLYMSNRKDTRWRAFNIEVAGVNFVRNYRSTFKPVLDQKGIQGLIADLRRKSS
ncbi:hypothetical protein NBRC116583_29090 [Arenicella sp. 4NH20-0111]|uniref:MlaC/ttg2D family ABC transporter substrate-binding protein n=1 Tax=Arenicella sp. 4NH20-0111 TaxID=3127648 RepID=UPI0031083A20